MDEGYKHKRSGGRREEGWKDKDREQKCRLCVGEGCGVVRENNPSRWPGSRITLLGNQIVGRTGVTWTRGGNRQHWWSPTPTLRVMDERRDGCPGSVWRGR